MKHDWKMRKEINFIIEEVLFVKWSFDIIAQQAEVFVTMLLWFTALFIIAHKPLLCLHALKALAVIFPSFPSLSVYKAYNLCSDVVTDLYAVLTKSDSNLIIF